ncbi:coiled-coil domain-containing protein 27 [Rhinophrynus dorsalis]
MQSVRELNWTGNRRPATAVWKIPKSDSRREKYCKSATETGQSSEIQSHISSSLPSCSFDNDSSSQVINLQMMNGASNGCLKHSISSMPKPHIDAKLPFIHSPNELPKWSNSAEGSAVNLHYSGHQCGPTYLTSVELKTPWYISMLHEKESNLLKLGEEINRLSGFEIECHRKDDIINTLRNELFHLQEELRQTGPSCSAIEKSLPGEMVAEEQSSEHEEETPDHADECVSPSDDQLPIHNLQEELDTVKKDYEMAKGCISSLQRMISFHESQLRKVVSEKKNLQKELEDRKMQVQAMTKKFSSLREERKHIEVMAAIEMENYNLRELVSELKSEMTKRNEMVTDLKSEVQKLQKQSMTYQTQIKEQESEKKEIQSKADELMFSAQRIKVALVSIESRFERFRGKIIQATYSAPGVKCPQVALTDNEILEAMQKAFCVGLRKQTKCNKVKTIQYNKHNITM